MLNKIKLHLKTNLLNFKQMKNKNYLILLFVSVCTLELIQCASIKITYEKKFGGLDSSLVEELVESQPQTSLNVEGVQPKIHISSIDSDEESEERNEGYPKVVSFRSRPKFISKVGLNQFTDDHSANDKVETSKGVLQDLKLKLPKNYANIKDGSYEREEDIKNNDSSNTHDTSSYNSHRKSGEDIKSDDLGYMEYLHLLDAYKSTENSKEDSYSAYLKYLADMQNSELSEESNNSEQTQIANHKLKAASHERKGPHRFHYDSESYEDSDNEQVLKSSELAQSELGLDFLKKLFFDSNEWVQASESKESPYSDLFKIERLLKKNAENIDEDSQSRKFSDEYFVYASNEDASPETNIKHFEQSSEKNVNQKFVQKGKDAHVAFIEGESEEKEKLEDIVNHIITNHKQEQDNNDKFSDEYFVYLSEEEANSEKDNEPTVGHFKVIENFKPEFVQKAHEKQETLSDGYFSHISSEQAESDKKQSVPSIVSFKKPVAHNQNLDNLNGVSSGSYEYSSENWSNDDELKFEKYKKMYKDRFDNNDKNGLLKWLDTHIN
jgi:hypothetical protein